MLRATTTTCPANTCSATLSWSAPFRRQMLPHPGRSASSWPTADGRARRRPWQAEKPTSRASPMSRSRWRTRKASRQACGYTARIGSDLFPRRLDVANRKGPNSPMRAGRRGSRALAGTRCCTGRIHVEMQLVAAGCFGLVHGFIGMPEQLIRACSMTAERGDANAGCADAELFVEPVGPCELAQDLVAQLACLHGGRVRRVAQVVEDDDEFVATQARHGNTNPDAGEQAPRHLTEHPVAGLVAKCVVDDFEIVHVDEQKGAVSSAAAAGCELMLEAVQQKTAVGLFCLWFVVGEVAKH